ncbi:hypothetical protein HK104_001571 [Borealophlyctis nickersoniae]|nr:hypothetical protein HK104_001571 [Borealophlyctis nickersoniae]
MPTNITLTPTAYQPVPTQSYPYPQQPPPPNHYSQPLYSPASPAPHHRRKRDAEGIVDQLRAELDFTRSARDDAQRKADDATKRAEELDRQLAESFKAKLELETEVSKVRAAASSSDDTVAASVGLVGELQERIAELEAEVARLTRHKARLEAHSVEAKKVYDELCSIVDTERKRFASVSSQLHDTSVAYEQTARELEYLKRNPPPPPSTVLHPPPDPQLLRDMEKSRAIEKELRGRVDELLKQVAGNGADLTPEERKDRIRKAAQAELESPSSQLRAALTAKQGEIENLTEALRQRDEEYNQLLQRNMEIQMQLAGS